MEKPSKSLQQDHSQKRPTKSDPSRFTDKRRKQKEADKHTLGGF